MNESKYMHQAKHIKNNYSQFKFNLKPDILESFKQKCKENETTPTTEIKRFISEYIKNNS